MIWKLDSWPGSILEEGRDRILSTEVESWDMYKLRRSCYQVVESCHREKLVKSEKIRKTAQYLLIKYHLDTLIYLKS